MIDGKQQISKLGIISHPDLGQVRSVMIKGEPCFIAKDVCEILGLGLLLVGCSKVNYLPATRVERVIDTITRTVPDSSALRALFACDSLGQVYVRELTEYKGREASQEVEFKDGELRVETKWRTQYIDRISEVHDTTTVVERVEVERIVKHVPQFFWWTFGIALFTVGWLIYKITRLFKR